MLEHDAVTRRSIAVIGAGYVGLASAVGLAGTRGAAR
jgi:predicted NAD/FAD-binding protein